MEIVEDRLGFTEHDFLIQDEGTLVVLHPQNDAARSWIEDTLYTDDGERPTWWGGGVVIEHRPARAILQALRDEGYDLGEMS